MIRTITHHTVAFKQRCTSSKWVFSRLSHASETQVHLARSPPTRRCTDPSLV
ncbi:hypothetical protein M3J09_000206 [Ascochyta lentis]